VIKVITCSEDYFCPMCKKDLMHLEFSIYYDDYLCYKCYNKFILNNNSFIDIYGRGYINFFISNGNIMFFFWKNTLKKHNKRSLLERIKFVFTYHRNLKTVKILSTTFIGA
jgi:hypothetical protein